MYRMAAAAIFLSALSTPLYASYDSGLAAVERADFSAALRDWLPLARKGDARAQLQVGLLYMQGAGVPLDHGQAAKWFERSARLENPVAQHNLGELYENGLGVPQDYSKAVALYRKAATSKLAAAQYKVGSLYERGLGVAPSKEEALRWYDLAESNESPWTSADAVTLFDSGTHTRGPGDTPKVDADSWTAMVRAGRTDPLPDKVERMKTYFEALPRANAQALWGDPKYWASLPETLTKKAASPRDLAVAFYATLRAMGIAETDLRIVSGLVPRLDNNGVATMVPYTVLAICAYGSIAYIDPLKYNILMAEPPTGFSGAVAVNESGEWLLVGKAISSAWGKTSQHDRYLSGWVAAWDGTRQLASPN